MWLKLNNHFSLIISQKILNISGCYIHWWIRAQVDLSGENILFDLFIISQRLKANLPLQSLGTGKLQIKILNIT